MAKKKAKARKKRTAKQDMAKPKSVKVEVRQQGVGYECTHCKSRDTYVTRTVKPQQYPPHLQGLLRKRYCKCNACGECFIDY